jgi:hypothetical protein
MRTLTRNLSVGALALLLGAFAATPVQADIATYAADLSGANEVPAVTTAATGAAGIVVDTETLTGFWYLEFVDLSSGQTGAHFHNAPAGANGGVMHALPLGASLSGVWAMSQADYDALTNGDIYVNVHSQQHPSGEIRGQLTLLTIVPNDDLSFGAVKALFR